ncbi:hypothetical protein DFH09DRAFT_1330681 [Mycena vulgaris]|nr:hypothetical protein DFH09DRAFT_1330681 [Mycena vulgaris]
MRGSAAAREEASRVEGEEAPANDAKGASAPPIVCLPVTQLSALHPSCELIRRVHDVRGGEQPIPTTRHYREHPGVLLGSRSAPHRRRKRVRAAPAHDRHTTARRPLKKAPPRTVHFDDEALVVPRLRRTPEGTHMGPGSAEKGRGGIVNEGYSDAETTCGGCGGLE